MMKFNSINKSRPSDQHNLKSLNNSNITIKEDVLEEIAIIDQYLERI